MSVTNLSLEVGKVGKFVGKVGIKLVNLLVKLVKLVNLLVKLVKLVKLVNLLVKLVKDYLQEPTEKPLKDGECYLRQERQ